MHEISINLFAKGADDVSEEEEEDAKLRGSLDRSAKIIFALPSMRRRRREDVGRLGKWVRRQLRFCSSNRSAVVAVAAAAAATCHKTNLSSP